MNHINDEIKQEIKQEVQRDMEITKKENAEEEEAKYFLMSLHSDIAYAEAKKEGNVVVLPEENQLLLDIDSPEAAVLYDKNKPRFHTHSEHRQIRAQLRDQNKGDHHGKVKGRRV